MANFQHALGMIVFGKTIVWTAGIVWAMPYAH